MDAIRRDADLVRAIGTWGLAANVVSMVVGAGIFVVPAALAAQVGPYAPLVLVACAMAIGSVAICFAEGCSRIPSSGGAFAFLEFTSGRLTGQIIGTLLWLSNILACGGISLALAETVTSVVPPPFKAPVRVAVIVGVIGGIAAVNMMSATRGLRLLGGAIVLKLLPLAVLVTVGWSAVHIGNFSAAAAPGVSGLGRASILALFAFIGMEGGLCASGEVKDPSRTIPRALAIALCFVTVLYLAIQVITQGILGGALAQSHVPLADAMARVSPYLRALMLAGTAMSMFGWLCSSIFSVPRLWLACAREGLMPRALRFVHPRRHTPQVAILCYAIVGVTLALTGTFAELAVLTTLACAPVFIAACAAAWRLERLGVAEAGEPLNFRGLKVAAIVGIASMLVLIALASRAEVVGLLVVIGVSAAVYGTINRVRHGSFGFALSPGGGRIKLRSPHGESRSA